MTKLTPARLRERAKKIKLVLFDVDGILTNGCLFHFVDTSGAIVELKGMNTIDSISLTWLASAGLKTGIISGRHSRGFEERAKMLKMTYIYQHRLDKATVFDEICENARVRADEALYMGDDLPDVPVLKAAGLAITVPNARPEVKAVSHWVTRSRGGEGAVREVAELLLKAQGAWKDVLQRYECRSR